MFCYTMQFKYAQFAILLYNENKIPFGLCIFSVKYKKVFLYSKTYTSFNIFTFGIDSIANLPLGFEFYFSGYDF